MFYGVATGVKQFGTQDPTVPYKYILLVPFHVKYHGQATIIMEEGGSCSQNASKLIKNSPLLFYVSPETALCAHCETLQSSALQLRKWKFKEVAGLFLASEPDPQSGFGMFNVQ